jgi:hypothetical protein
MLVQPLTSEKCASKNTNFDVLVAHIDTSSPSIATWCPTFTKTDYLGLCLVSNTVFDVVTHSGRTQCFRLTFVCSSHVRIVVKRCSGLLFNNRAEFLGILLPQWQVHGIWKAE